MAGFRRQPGAAHERKSSAPKRVRPTRHFPDNLQIHDNRTLAGVSHMDTFRRVDRDSELLAVQLACGSRLQTTSSRGGKPLIRISLGGYPAYCPGGIGAASFRLMPGSTRDGRNPVPGRLSQRRPPSRCRAHLTVVLVPFKGPETTICEHRRKVLGRPA